jgi:hypothetical protein
MFESLAHSDDESNSSHRHFIAVLKENLQLLADAGCMNKFMRESDTDKNVPQSPWTGLMTGFDKLEIEDLVDDDNENEPEQDLGSGAKESKEVMYEAEVDQGDDFVIQAYTFFLDLHFHQTAVVDAFRKYLDKKCDLLTFTIVANQAQLLVNQLEEELANAASASRQHLVHSHDALVREFYDRTKLTGLKEKSQPIEIRRAGVTTGEPVLKIRMSKRGDEKDRSKMYFADGPRRVEFFYQRTACSMDVIRCQFSELNQYPNDILRISHPIFSDPSTVESVKCHPFWETEHVILCQYMNELKLELVSSMSTRDAPIHR